VPKAIVQKVVSLEEMMEDLAKRITENMKMSFKDYSKIGKVEKVNVIVSFLAMLELVKQGIIKVRQDNNFQEIHMETDTIAIPKY
jgi:chromatin segregation and condensation protein Rec8/ScpA/Scc1 (kleisin family)